MKWIIAGTRTFHGSDIEELIMWFFNYNYEDIDEIVSGGADGVDNAGEIYAKKENIPLKIFEANWQEHGRAAGPIRNKQMAEYGDKLLLIWDGESKGSKNMKSEMQKLNKAVFEIVLKSN